MSLSEESKYEIGQRDHSVSDSRRVGTVMYVGPVDGYSGTWVGVDWDNGDGKHDGTVKGVRYFRTSTERSGSLVRPNTTSKRVSFIEAFALRYTGETTKEDEMYVYSMMKKRVAIQLLGKDKVHEKFNRLEELEHASLAYLGVSSPGPPHAIHGVIPRKYYLGDGGYPNIRGLLTPYRGHRYHLSEYNVPRARRVTSAEELFNHRHSSLRTTVERTFALLKGRFPILKAQVSYPYRVQVGIVLATCVLHNFIIDYNPHAEQFDVQEGAFDDANESTSFITDHESVTQSIQRGSNNELRTSITSEMFMDFQNR